MRNVFGAILALMLAGAAGEAQRFAQVINGEGNFESNRGFDRAPEEAPAADVPLRPADSERKQDGPRQR